MAEMKEEDSGEESGDFYNSDLYFDLLPQKLASEFIKKNNDDDDDDDDGIWDSMAVMATEEWNNEEEAGGTMEVKDLIPNGHICLTATERCEVFLTAAQFGMLDLVKELYATYGNDLLQYRDEDLYSALHRASYNGHLSVVEYLLSIGADIKACTEDDWQPLHCACRWNKADVASLLLQNGAVINSQTKGGQTPLHLAASNDKAKATLELLLTTKGVDVNIRNKAGETARQLASSYGRLGYLFEMTEDCLNCRP